MPALKHSKSYLNIHKIQTFLFTTGGTEPITSSAAVGPEVGYDCDDYNPCTPENAAEGKFYFPHKDPTKYVQCSEHGQCYVMNCSSGLIWDSAINSCHWSPITTSTTSSPSTASATTGVDGTTAIGTLIQYFSRFRSYLPSGLFHAKAYVWLNAFWQTNELEFNPPTNWEPVKWHDSEMKWQWNDWFPVRWRIDFKPRIFVFNCLHGVVPSSLVELQLLPADSPNLGSHRSTTQPSNPVTSWCHGHDK